MATEARETAGLIGSDKVEGTAVYDAKGEKIGSIERVMIDKRSGQVAYAVLSFGGFLGIGSDYYPIPWASLKYDTSLGGYRLDITEQQLKVRRSTRAIVGTGKIARVAARFTIITAQRGENTDRSWAGRWPPGRRPCPSYEGVLVSASFDLGCTLSCGGRPAPPPPPGVASPHTGMRIMRGGAQGEGPRTTHWAAHGAPLGAPRVPPGSGAAPPGAPPPWPRGRAGPPGAAVGGLCRLGAAVGWLWWSWCWARLLPGVTWSPKGGRHRRSMSTMSALRDSCSADPQCPRNRR